MVVAAAAVVVVAQPVMQKWTEWELATAVPRVKYHIGHNTQHKEIGATGKHGNGRI